MPEFYNSLKNIYCYLEGNNSQSFVQSLFGLNSMTNAELFFEQYSFLNNQEKSIVNEMLIELELRNIIYIPLIISSESIISLKMSNNGEELTIKKMIIFLFLLEMKIILKEMLDWIIRKNILIIFLLQLKI